MPFINGLRPELCNSDFRSFRDDVDLSRIEVLWIGEHGKRKGKICSVKRVVCSSNGYEEDMYKIESTPTAVVNVTCMCVSKSLESC